MKTEGGLGLLALLAAGAWWFWKKEADVQGLANKLQDGLPPRLGQWADALARAANNTAPASVSTLKWATFIAAVMDRESNGGGALRPRGATGTGDFTARKGRWLDRTDVAQIVDALPGGWLTPRDRQGNPLPPPYAIPQDGMGWGRGLMQLDLGSHQELLGVQPSAGGNVLAGARELRRLFLLLDPGLDDQEKYRRTADAYNAGERALTADDPDALTTGKNYGGDVLARAQGLEAGLLA